MTPASVLAAIPDDLLRRSPRPANQLHTAKALARWLDQRGHRPTLLEIEQERARRTPTTPRHSQPDNRKGTPMSDTDQTEDPMRLYVRQIFKPDEDELEEPANEPPKPPGYVAREGNIPQPPHDDGMRAFTKALFGHDPNS